MDTCPEWGLGQGTPRAVGSPDLRSSGFPGGSEGKASACNAGDPGRSLGRKDPLEKEMTTHSGTLAWKIPWMEKPVG